MEQKTKENDLQKQFENEEFNLKDDFYSFYNYSKWLEDKLNIAVEALRLFANEDNYTNDPLIWSVWINKKENNPYNKAREALEQINNK